MSDYEELSDKTVDALVKDMAENNHQYDNTSDEAENEIIEEHKNNGLQTDKLKEFADIYREREKARAKDKELTAKLAELEPGYIDHMVDHGIDQLSLTGGDTLEIRERIVASCVKIEGTDKVDRERVAKALKDAGLGWLIGNTYNTNSLSSYISELIKNGGKLPESFKGVIEPFEIRKIGVKKYQ